MPATDAQRSGPATTVASARPRRATVLALVGGVVAVVAVVALVFASPWAVDTRVPETVATGTGEVPFEASEGGSCHQLYSPATLPDATLAFAGTVSALDTGGPLFTDRMTFRVTEWFRGGDVAEVTLPMPALADEAGGGVPAVTVGTELLVAGTTSRSGGPDLDDPLPWATCGFVRYADDATTATWRDVLADGPAPGAP